MYKAAAHPASYSSTLCASYNTWEFSWHWSKHSSDRPHKLTTVYCYNKSHTEPQEGKVWKMKMASTDRLNEKELKIWRLTELRVKVCSMYSPVCVRLARFQRWSLRLVHVKESIRWMSAERVCESLCASQCRETQLNGGGEGGEGVKRSLKILTATGSSKASSLLPLMPVPLPPSLSFSLSALNVSPLPSVFTSLTVSASSCLLCYAHKIDMLPPGMQTSATNASTLKRRGDTQRAKNCPGSRSRVKTVCFL